MLPLLACPIPRPGTALGATTEDGSACGAPSKMWATACNFGGSVASDGGGVQAQRGVAADGEDAAVQLGDRP
jgi:hypothetical protein